MNKKTTKKYWSNKRVKDLDKQFGRGENELFFKTFSQEEKDSIREEMYLYFTIDKSMAKYEKLNNKFHKACADKFVDWYCGDDTGNRLKAPISSIIHALFFENIIIYSLEKYGFEILPSPKNSVYQGDISFIHKDFPLNVIRLELKSSTKCVHYDAWTHLFIDYQNHIEEYKSASCIVDFFLIHNPEDIELKEIVLMTKKQFEHPDTKYSTMDAYSDTKIITRSENVSIKNILNVFDDMLKDLIKEENSDITLAQQLELVRDLKAIAVKNQNYEEAARLRDLEKELTEKL